MADIEHYFSKKGKVWIALSGCGNHSLQMRYNKKPSSAQLEADYAFMDDKIELALRIEEVGVKKVLEQLGFCTHEKTRRRNPTR